MPVQYVSVFVTMSPQKDKLWFSMESAQWFPEGHTWCFEQWVGKRMTTYIYYIECQRYTDSISHISDITLFYQGCRISGYWCSLSANQDKTALYFTISQMCSSFYNLSAQQAGSIQGTIYSSEHSTGPLRPMPIEISAAISIGAWNNTFVF